MSRPESTEYHFLPGLGIQNRSPTERNLSFNFLPPGLSPSVQQQDRRPSTNGTNGYSAFGRSSLSRSSGLQDQSVHSYAFPEIPDTNRTNTSPPLAPTNSSSLTSYSQATSPPSTKFQPTTGSNSPHALFYSPSTISNGECDSIHCKPLHTSVQYISPPSFPAPSNTTLDTLSTLWWGELEPWMDEEYARQVCGLMGWDPVGIKVPNSSSDPAIGQQANNSGYCFLTFPTPAHAAAVLAQVNASSTNGKGVSSTMPNSNNPFVMNWASNVSNASLLPSTFPAVIHQPAQPAQQYQKEYSIFVGDLAPETSNSDLVAVFRNPVLGLRSDREPKFIRPFLSCKSAKIMLDPVTGVSRGYGFVRFTDEADQQRALIEMHGLYCLSRPMRISPATAKFKPSAGPLPFDLPPVFTPPATQAATNGSNPSVTITLPLPDSAQAKSVSAPIAATGSNMSLNGISVSNSSSGSSIGGSHSSHSLSSGTASSASISSSSGFGIDDTTLNLTGISPNVLSQLVQQYSNSDASKVANSTLQEEDIRRFLASAAAQRYQLTEESLKHHVQARAILSNLMGPNGEQLTSTDPYNTTVFVGGLSPLISEETLRTFFAPFGDIHYVKVPVGKHCGFVQFVKKADAERAIEKMQGFPIGGSRIRLSWGRSQYKAAQAAAQAAQTAAIQTAYTTPPVLGSLTPEQAVQVLQRFAMPYPNPLSVYNNNELEHSLLNTKFSGSLPQVDQKDETTNAFVSRPDMLRPQSNFSPFSPDPNNFYALPSERSRRDSGTYSRLDGLPHLSKAFAPGFFPQPQEMKINTTSMVNVGEAKVSPNSVHPSNANRYNYGDSADPLSSGPHRRTTEAPISRPTSGQLMSASHDQGPIQDLNGTLASLNLDRPWRSPEIKTRGG